MIQIVEKMARTTRTFVAMLVVAMMLLIGVTPALADPLPPATGNLHIHKIIGAEDSNLPHNGSVVASPGGTLVNGVQFDIYKVNTTSGIPAAGTGYSYKLSGSSLEVYSGANPVPATYSVTGAGSAKTTGLGTIDFNNLPQGLYLVIENVSASTEIKDTAGNQMFISSAVKPFLVAVPMTNPAGDGWLADVHVYPKNEALSVEKTVDTQSAVAVGDKISYKITVTIPGDIDKALKFAVTDEIDAALDVDPSSVVVKAQPGNAAFSATTHYVATKAGSNNRTLEVAFNATGRAALLPYTTVDISFDAIVNANILTNDDFEIANEATINFTNKDGVEFEADTDGEGPVIHTAAIQVSKLDETGAALNGSKFKIADTETNAKAGNFLRIDPTTKVIYKYGDTGYNGAGLVDYEIAPTIVAPSTSAVASFTGLKDVIVVGSTSTPQSYWLVETQAPSGYNMLSAPVEVTFTGSEAGHVAIQQVNNNKGFVLPMTGGAGTIAFTVAGIMLLGLAAIVFVTSRKRDKKDEII